MKTIPQNDFNYNSLIKNLIINKLSSNLKTVFDGLKADNNVHNYIDIISSLDKSLVNIAKETLIASLEAIDYSYRISKERKHKYHIKAYHSRTILTIFGEITIRRTFYSNKDNEGSFCYLDYLLGLTKYDYFDPYLKTLIIDYSAKYPMNKVASLMNDLVGNKVFIKDKFKRFSRQIIRNIILASKLSLPPLKELKTPNDLYIMADEKFVSLQNEPNINNKKKNQAMVKSVVVFDGREKIYENRYKLVNKTTFSSFGNKKFLDKALDYLYYTYDMDQIKNIYVMGDGASWIRSLTGHFKVNNKTNLVFGLDKFHFKQALHHIAFDKDITNILLSYILGDNQEGFNLICKALIIEKPHREKVISEKQKYIVNNWKNIQNLHTFNLKCPMESQISHTFADLLTSRPKAYSRRMLEIICKIRLLYENGHNLKELYLNNYNKKEILTLNKEILNFDVLNRDKATLSTYNQYLFAPDF